MDALRGFAGENRSMIINVVYVVAFLTALYYLYKFLVSGSELEVDLLNVELDANVPSSFPLPKSPDVRVKQGGGYTISFWMYITSWDFRSGMAKSVVQIMDSSLLSHSLFTTILYPNEPKMMIRVLTEGAGVAPAQDYNKMTNFDSLLSGQGSAAMFAPSMDMPMCDLQEIDLQRWINITVSINGRIVDVYYDGKLTRSCVLPDIPKAPASGAQAVLVGQKGGYGGKISGIQFFAYPLTPDRIYAIYQAGPRGAAGFLGYIAEKLGIKLTYAGAGGKQKAIGL